MSADPIAPRRPRLLRRRLDDTSITAKSMLAAIVAASVMIVIAGICVLGFLDVRQAETVRAASVVRMSLARDAWIDLSRAHGAMYRAISLRSLGVGMQSVLVAKAEARQLVLDARTTLTKAVVSDDPVLRDDGQAAEQALARYEAAANQAGAFIAADVFYATMFMNDAELKFRSARNAVADLTADAIAAHDRVTQEMDAELSSRVRLITIGTIVAALVSTLLGLWASRLLARPVVAITGVMGRLASGDLGITTPETERRDEIGAMARAVQVFKEQAIRKGVLETELREALDSAAHMSTHDYLTGLPNRRLYTDRLTQALASARRDDFRVAVMCLDLDRFKEVNDTLGHAAGDQLLRTVSTRLSACLRETDTLARFGGDEFAIVLPFVQSPGGPETLAERLIDAVEMPVELDGSVARIGLSIGIALSDPDIPCEVPQLLKDADVALYQAKETGRGRFCVHIPGMSARMTERRVMERDLRAAVRDRALTVVYQPQVDIATCEVVGAEALLRWNRPGYGPVPPDIFISLAESVDLIGEIGLFVLREACREAAAWPRHVRAAVNVSPVQFRQAGFSDAVAAVLTDTGFQRERLELEITEGVMLSDTEETLAILADLRRMGVRLAMDDFGTGYSSLGYLQKFRFAKIKIDRSFVARLGDDPNAAAIVRAVVGLSEALGVCANAEGIETKAQADMLKALGCREGQGFLYGRPMSAADLRGMLLAEERAEAA